MTTEATEKAADTLFDDYVYGLEPQVGTVHDMLDASDRLAGRYRRTQGVILPKGRNTHREGRARSEGL